jgi:hypothetical protein
MELTWLKPLTELSGPFATVVMDATREGARGRSEVELRWKDHRQRLAAEGAPDEVLEQMQQLALTPAAAPGRVGRALVANRDGVVLDVTLPEPPVRETGGWGPIPSLLPVVRGFARRLPYLLVDATITDARVEYVGLFHHEEQEVVGDNDVTHKVRGGGWSHRRYQRRVEDSIARNAKEFAETVTSEVRRRRPALVLVAGESKPVSDLLDALPQDVSEHVVRLSRRGEAQEDEIKDILEEELWRRRAALVDRLRTGEAHQTAATEGLENVVASLRAAQVDELLLADDPASDLTLWSGGRPELLGLTREDVTGLGSDLAEQVRADAAIVWALVGTDAAIELTEPGEVELADGIGATLRWAGATPG